MTKWISYDKLMQQVKTDLDDGKIELSVADYIKDLAEKKLQPLPFHKCSFTMQDLKVYDGMLNINNNIIYTPYVTTDFLDNMDGAEWKLID